MCSAFVFLLAWLLQLSGHAAVVSQEGVAAELSMVHKFDAKVAARSCFPFPGQFPTQAFTGSTRSKRVTDRQINFASYL